MEVTYQEAAAILSVPVNTIKDWIKKGILSRVGSRGRKALLLKNDVLALVGRTPADLVKTTWQRDFFRRRDPITAYWAGFLMADGCLEVGHYGSPQLKLSLATKDHCHVQEFASAIGLSQGSVKSRRGNQFGISLRDKHFVEDLKPWGIAPNKTHCFVEPAVSLGLLGYYIKGFFDGDGTVWTRPDGYVSIKLCSPIPCLQWVQEAIVKLGLPYEPKWSDRKPDRMWANLAINGAYAISHAYKQWHGGEFPRLDRKWKKIERYLESHPEPQWKQRHIRSQEDLDAAVKLLGRAPAEKQAAIKARIKKIAERKGLTLPASWADK